MTHSVWARGRGLACFVVLALPLATGCPKNPDAVDGATRTAGRGDGSDTSTGARLPERPRREIRRDAAADQALATAQARAQSQGRRAQVDTYLAVRRAYPETTAGEDALYQAGTIAFDLGDYVNARRSFNELLFENPLYEKAHDAKYKLGMSALETHAYRDAYQTLSSLAERSSGEEKEKLLAAAARAAEGAQLWGETLSAALKDAEAAQGPEAQKAALDRVTELVDSKVPFPEVARVQAELPPTHPAWPILTFKLARVYQHLRDWPHLQDITQKFLQSAPTHPFAAQAQELLAHANPQSRLKTRAVGVVLPLSGPYKPVGDAALRGIQVALKSSNVELVVKDSGGDVARATKAVEELALDEGVMAVIGPLAADESKHAAISAQELGVPVVTMTRVEGITDLGPFVFRNMLTYSAQTRALVDWGTQVMGFKSFGMLYPNAPYGKEFADDFWDETDKRGIPVRAAESYSADQTTFTTEVKKLVGRYYLDDRRDFVEAAQEATKDAKDSFRKRKALERARKGVEPIVDFDALFIPDDWQRVGLLAPALAVEDIITNSCDPKEIEKLKKTTGKDDIKTVTLLGINMWSSPKSADGVPQLIERGGKFVLCSVYVDGFYADSNRPATRKFVGAYREQFKDAPGLFEAMGYDSARMVRHVLDTQKPQTREQMRVALSSLKNFDGATGKTSINDKREADRPLFFLTVDLKGIRELTSNERQNGT